MTTKKSWYSPVAEADDRLRPKYPEAIVDRAIEWAQLPANAQIWEIGCGPGTATIDERPIGFFPALSRTQLGNVSDGAT